MGLQNVTMILSGMTTMEQIRDNVATFQTEEALTPEQIDIPRWMNLYNELHLTHDRKVWEKAMEEAAGPAACIGCGQCTTHCLQSIDVPGYMNKLSNWQSIC